MPLEPFSWLVGAFFILKTYVLNISMPKITLENACMVPQFFLIKPRIPEPSAVIKSLGLGISFSLS